MIRDVVDFGRAMRRARKRLGINQSELAARCGVSLNFITDLETGKPGCQIGKAITVAVELGFQFRDEPGPVLPSAGPASGAPSGTPEPPEDPEEDPEDDLGHIPRF